MKLHSLSDKCPAAGALLLTGLLVAGGWGAATTEVIGSYGYWPTTWQVLPGIGDTADAGIVPELDFVGDASNPELYHADNGSYLFCRMRVNLDTYTATPQGAFLWLIDVVGVGNTGIDAAFAWDAKSNIVASHGLEMCVAGISGPTWGNSQLADLDGNSGSKGSNDINGGGRTTDGYVRVTDGQSTTNFGGSTFIDFAVSWSYLETNTILRKGQSVKVNVASIHNATDQGAFNADLGNDAVPTDPITTAWSSAITIPEPSSRCLLAAAGAMGLLCRRRGANPTPS